MASSLDIAIPALCAWRENRGGGALGMQSVLNVLQNRANRDRTTMYAEAVKKLQFSSLTAKGDPELTLWPVEGDPQYVEAEQMMQEALAGQLADITHGATIYYAPTGIGPSSQTFAVPGGATVPFPENWQQSKVQFTTGIENQLFFKEIA